MTNTGQAGELDAAGGFRRRLAAREPLLGTVVTVSSVALAELTAAPFDFVWIDLEHGALDVGDVQPLAIGASAAGAAALARLPAADYAHTGALLDAGVDGLVAPQVEAAPAAACLVERLRYPPRGSRGFAARRGSGYGRDGAAAVAPLCLVQIESPRGVDHAAEIAAVDGVDALVVGWADLSLAFGSPDRVRSGALLEAAKHVQLAAAAAGKAAGIAGPDDPVVLASLADARSTLFVLAADVRIYARAVDSAAAALREQLASRPEPMDAHVGA